ncbi:MAG TPA: alpha/beta fold hydrolase, partial [Mesotoga sp.]|nr:alpha/beta fold hydrolase [Mesotoga sp.]
SRFAVLKAYMSRDCFIYAFRTANLEFEAVRIPYGDDFIPAYWISPLTQSSQTKKRTIMMMSGFDGTSEEMYFQSGAAALNRGYSLLLFDGPGQVGMRRFSTETPFRADFEVAVAKVVDYLLSRGDVDPSKIALYGISLGGYFSLRAAAHEPRIKALISNSPITDIYKYMIGVAGEGAMNSSQDIGLDYIDEIPAEYLSKGKKLQILNIILRYGERSMFAAFERMKEFTVGEAIKNIRAPFLGMVSQGEGLGAMGQAEEAVKGVSGPSSLRVFTKDEGADSHCQLTNLPLSNAVLLDWLDEVFGVRS